MDIFDHEVLLEEATPTELQRLVELVATGRLARLPVQTHSEPFV